MKIGKLNKDRSGNIDVSPLVVAIYPLAALQDFTSYSHYLMLGLNDNYGCYTEEDIAITLSAETKKEKQEKNFEVIKERLQNMDISGLAVRRWKKLCCIHSEGNFFPGRRRRHEFSEF